VIDSNGIVMNQDSMLTADEYFEGAKYTAPAKPALKTEKVRLDLNPPEAMFGMAQAFEDGAKKRSEHNWEVGPDSHTWSFQDRLRAIEGHALRLRMGEDTDPVSGLHHAAHIMANGAMLYTASLKKLGNDDRLIKPKKPTLEELVAAMPPFDEDSYVGD